MNVHCFRLRRGQDILVSLQEYMKENHIDAATILSGVGCVSTAKIRDASGITIKSIDEDMEIVSLNGTLSQNRIHLHIALSKEDLSTIGGHLVEGCIVNTTAEIVILELDGYKFDKEYDKITGYDELSIKKVK